MFGIIAIIMKVAPLGAFGAQAFTIGKYGPSALFVFIGVGAITRVAGFSIVRFIGYIRDELLIVLGTSSSESAPPSLMEKLERLGCSRQVVGLVVPTGYSFNLDGANI